MGAAEKLLTPGSHGDVAVLTGAHTKRCQIRNLLQNGIAHTINAAGWPVVLWSAVDGSEPAKVARPAWRSNKAA